MNGPASELLEKIRPAQQSPLEFPSFILDVRPKIGKMQVNTCTHEGALMKDSSSSSNPDQTRARIIQAASQLFTEKGFSGTTTRAIAELAGVNEVTLFRHFGSKEKLAKAIMDQFGGQAIAGDLELRFSGDYVQDLTLIGRMMMKVMTERIDAIRMAICEADKFPEFRQVVAENPRQLRQMLARYFQRQMDANMIHSGHPEAMAQAFLGMFFSYTILQGFLLDSLQPEISSEDILEQFVTLFVRGTRIERE
jgi:AcrR family transcriptional regulator